MLWTTSSLAAAQGRKRGRKESLSLPINLILPDKLMGFVNFLYISMLFLDTQVSLAPTYVSLSVGRSVGHTFEFPWPLNISVRQSYFLKDNFFSEDNFSHEITLSHKIVFSHEITFSHKITFVLEITLTQ